MKNQEKKQILSDRFTKIMFNIRFYIYLLISIYIMSVLGLSIFTGKPVSDYIDWQWWLMLFGLTVWSSEGMKQLGKEKKQFLKKEFEEKEKTMEEELWNKAMKINKN